MSHRDLQWQVTQEHGQDTQEQATQVDLTPARNGIVDFGGAWSQTQLNSIPALDVHSVHESVEDDASPGIPSSLQRDTHLKTPGLAGRKRNRKGETISPTTAPKTPGSALSNMFGHRNAQPLMTATQMFENTQAMTSPAGDLARSDPVETRPSPNFLHANTVSPSVHALSSPTKLGAAAFSIGPRETYKPIGASQERRDALSRLHRDRTAPASSSKVAFDDDTQSTSPGYEVSSASTKRFHNAALSRGKRSSSKNMRSHSETLPRAQPPRASNPNLTRLSPPNLVVIPDDNSNSSDEDSVYDYDEFGGDIVQSQRRSQSEQAAEAEDEVLVSDREEDMEVAGSPEPEPQGLPEHPSREVKTGDNHRVDSSQEASSANAAVAVVANSQNAEPKSSSHPPPRMIDPSSISSYVPGSQLPLGSSQWRPILEAPVDTSKFSSMPRPPLSSGPEDTHIGVSGNLPSSPPIPVVLDPPGKDLPAVDDVTAQSAPTENERTVARPLQNENVEPAADVFIRTSASAQDSEKASQKAALDLAAKPNRSDSTKTSMFDTGATHISASQPRSSAQASQSRRPVSESPRKVGNVRKLADIANDPSPPDSLGEVDISVGMDLMNEDDEAFLRMTKSPVKTKNKRVYGRRGVGHKLVTDRAGELGSEVSAGPAPDASDQASSHEVPVAEAPTALVVQPQPITAVAIESSSPVVPHRKRRKTAALGKIHRSVPANDQDARAAVTTEPTIPAEACVTATVDSEANEVSKIDPPSGAAESNATRPTAALSGRNRVLALFSGNLNAYYPATCTSIVGSNDKVKFHVCFDDGTETALERHHVSAFDLRLDDVVKVDLPNMRQHMYTVCGFDAPKESSQQDLLPDFNGHEHVQLKVKASSTGRKSLPNTSASKEVFTVPTRTIKVTPMIWPKFQVRAYTPPDVTTASRSATPVLPTSTPATPSSRSRRQTLNSGHIPLGISAPVSRTPVSAVFANMAFAISYSSTAASDAARDHTISQITSSGGTILHSGLHELFDVSLDSSSEPNNGPAFRLKPANTHLKFVALIADTHSRTQKYIQSLALALPTLHHKWITDSLRAGRPLEWSKYLLPAGESTFLGAVRSRSLIPYGPASASLATQIEKRERLLDGGGVLLVADEGKKKRTDRREVYAFLSLALGADRVRLVEDVAQASRILHAAGEGQGSAGWRWLHTSSERVENVASLLRGEKGRVEQVKGKGKKRKRASGVAEEGNGEKMSVLLEQGVRVVGDEFVIQSLILGGLVEE
ncbi:DNA repair protein Crb2 Tudor domain-containing protein [Elsinoe fawcettii]|nr:DNA repair protein Crb2 Tudor domain-containing protein [Elsinoe fawcettii]